MGVFEELESEVRSYCRNWPVVFDRASGSWLYDEAGRPYLDFFSGAGALNYGHNHPYIKERVLEYLAEDRIVHSLDMYTRAKQEFLETLNEVILKPRALDYRVQFPGPAGTNAVEAAMKLVRKVTGRTDIVCSTTPSAFPMTSRAACRTLPPSTCSSTRAAPLRIFPPGSSWRRSRVRAVSALPASPGCGRCLCAVATPGSR
jgi:diaminobutyrate-2-oxoglutarate transaminase